MKFAEKILLVLFALISIWLMWHTFSYQDGQFKLASKVYSDFGAHLPMVRSFSLGKNFPPEYPQFASEPIRYHYLFYLLVAFLEMLGLNLAWSMNILSALGFFLLLLMLYNLTKLIFSSRKAGLLTVILFLFNGSLSFVEFFRKIPVGSNWLIELFELKHFVVFGPWDGGKISAFWNLNIYTNQRHLALSYALVLVLLWPLLTMAFKKSLTNIKPSWWQCLLIWLGFGFFPLLHLAGFVILLAFMLALFVLFTRLLKSNWLIVYIWASIFGLITFFGLPSNSAIFWKIGFLSNQSNLWLLIEYWFFNIGFYLPAIFFLLFKLKWPAKKLLIIFLSFFLVANLWQFSADMINNHKFISFFMLGMNVLLAGELIRFWQGNIHRKVSMTIILMLLTFSGWVDLFPIINDHYYYLNDVDKSLLATYVRDNTEPNSVFLTNNYFYNPILLAGRKSFLDYGYFAWSLGYDDAKRRAELATLFSANISQFDLCSALISNEIDYILINTVGSDIAFPQPKLSIVYNQFQADAIFDNEYKLYQVKNMCFDQVLNLLKNKNKI